MNAEQRREYEELKLAEIFGDAIENNNDEKAIEDDEELLKIKEKIRQSELQILLDNEIRIRYDKLTQSILNTVDTDTAMLIMERAELYWLRELNSKGGF